MKAAQKAAFFISKSDYQSPQKKLRFFPSN